MTGMEHPMREITLTAAIILLTTPLAAQTAAQVTNDLTVEMAPQQYRICNDRPTRPAWMDEIHPREAYKALTLMRLYELRAWEAIRASGDCGCDVRFPSWEDASEEFEEQYAALTQAEQTQIRLALRDEQNQIAREVQDLCEAQGTW